MRHGDGKVFRRSGVGGRIRTLAVFEFNPVGFDVQEIVVLLLRKRWHHIHLSVLDGECGAVLKEAFVAILDAYHFRREHRETCIARTYRSFLAGNRILCAGSKSAHRAQNA